MSVEADPHHQIHHLERRPMPAFRDEGERRATLLRISQLILRRWPDLAEHPETLLTPPPIDEWSLSTGNGPYSGDQRLIVQSVLSEDIVASLSELRDTFAELRAHGEDEANQPPTYSH